LRWSMPGLQKISGKTLEVKDDRERDKGKSDRVGCCIFDLGRGPQTKPSGFQELAGENVPSGRLADLEAFGCSRIFMNQQPQPSR
jgi:hypothetical protein